MILINDKRKFESHNWLQNRLDKAKMLMLCQITNMIDISPLGYCDLNIYIMITCHTMYMYVNAASQISKHLIVSKS